MYNRLVIRPVTYGEIDERGAIDRPPSVEAGVPDMLREHPMTARSALKGLDEIALRVEDLVCWLLAASVVLWLAEKGPERMMIQQTLAVTSP